MKLNGNQDKINGHYNSEFEIVVNVTS